MSTPLLNADTDRDAWLAARRLGVSASEIAAVMGISPWESPFSLYWRKVNGWEVEENEAMRTGTLLEATIADWWAYNAMEEGWELDAPGLVAHPERPWQLATPDRTVHGICPTCVNGPPETFGCWDCRNTHHDGPPLAVLECKWVSYSWDGWGEPGTDDIPVHYRAQVLWQCDVVGVDTWYLAALGPGGFREYTGTIGDAERTDLEAMRKAGQEFMDRIASGDAPPLDSHDATLTTLKRLHPDLTDEEVEVPFGTAQNYLAACAALKQAEADKQGYEIVLRALMGSARRATSNGERVATRVISDIAESTRTVAAHRRDYLLTPREKKT